MKQVNVKKPYKTAMVRGLTAERTIELIKKAMNSALIYSGCNSVY